MSPHCKVTASRSAATNTPTHCGCWTNDENNLSTNRTRTVNQLYTLLRELVAGGAYAAMPEAGKVCGLP